MEYGTGFSFATEKQHRLEAVGEPQTPTSNTGTAKGATFALHPYLGFVWNRDAKTPWSELITPSGLLGEEDPYVASRDPKKAIVALTGGSVAERLFVSSRQVMRDKLKNLPVFRHRKVVFVMLGMSGWRQPQQLISVAYYLSQGGRMDMLINLDGFNEAAFGVHDRQVGMYPTFPYLWNQFFPHDYDPNDMGQMAHIALWRGLRRQTALIATHLRYSVTATTFWGLLDHYMANKAGSAEAGLQTQGKPLPFYLAGPQTYSTAPVAAIYDMEGELWKNSSLQLAVIAKANGFAYFHFLQPNQYVPDSKPLSEVEAEKYYQPALFRADSVVHTYPIFEAAIPQMRAKGANVYSLTQLFKTTHETVYADACCHFNALGDARIATAMGNQIMRYYKNQ